MLSGIFCQYTQTIDLDLWQYPRNGNHLESCRETYFKCFIIFLTMLVFFQTICYSKRYICDGNNNRINSLKTMSYYLLALFLNNEVKRICILQCSWLRRCLCLPCSWKEVAKNQTKVFNKTFEFFFHKNVASLLRIFYASWFCLLLTKYGPEWSCTKSPAHLAIKCFKQPRLNSSW